MSGRAMRSRTKASGAGSAPTVIPATTEPDVQPPPTKRAKTNKAKKPAAQTARKKGRLSVLPSLPLDVLFEIFGHLGPADLLHLARTTKSFRAVLMSRQSAFLWKEVHDSVDDIDKFPCPDEMSLPRWINLVYGGSFCDEIGCSSRANRVLWNLNRRLCKSCQGKLLISGEDVWISLATEVVMLLNNFSDVVPHEMITRGGRLRMMFLRSDIESLGEELHALAKEFDYPIQTTIYPAPDGTPEWQAALASYKARRGSMCHARYAHAEECEMKDELKTAVRGDELEALKEARFLDVKKRLMAIGFEAVDAGSYLIRVHKEVKQAKPLTERVWTRIGPLLRAEAERIRDARLERERRARMTVRFRFAHRRYERVTLNSVAPSIICFAPKHDVIFRLPRIATYITEDVDRPPVEEYDACATAFSEADVLTLVADWISLRQASLREKVPQDWARASATEEEIGAHWPTPTDPPTVELYAQVADLDLAAYTFKCTAPACPDAQRVFHGLDILAHDCVNHIEGLSIEHMLEHGVLSQPIDFTLHASPLQDHHAAVLRVLLLLELDPTKARPVDLDKADKFFTAEPRDYTAGQPFLTWRQAVAAGAIWCKVETVRLTDERETSYINRHHTAFHEGDPLHAIDDDPDWACARCAHVADPAGVADNEVVRWSSLHDVHAHILLVHGVVNAKEGQHYFYDRSRDRMAGDSGEGDAFKFLPCGVELDTALSVLDDISGGVTPFGLMQAMMGLGGGHGTGLHPFLLTSLMANMLSEGDSDSDDFMDF